MRLKKCFKTCDSHGFWLNKNCVVFIQLLFSYVWMKIMTLSFESRVTYIFHFSLIVLYHSSSFTKFELMIISVQISSRSDSNLKLKVHKIYILNTNVAHENAQIRKKHGKEHGFSGQIKCNCVLFKSSDLETMTWID